MTPERIAELRRLAEAATKGPWELKERGDCVSPCPTDDCEKPAPVCAVPGYVMHGNQADWWEQWVADGDFIAAARSAFPELLDEVERLRARCERLEKVREAAQAVDARIGHFHNAPGNDGMPMLSLIIFAAKTLQAALAAARGE